MRHKITLLSCLCAFILLSGPLMAKETGKTETREQQQTEVQQQLQTPILQALEFGQTQDFPLATELENDLSVNDDSNDTKSPLLYQMSIYGI